MHRSADPPFCEQFLCNDLLSHRDHALIAALRDVVPGILRANGTPGISLSLARYNRPVWEAAFGWAVREPEKAMNCETIFRIGSLGKVFVAISVMQLAERGVVDLDGDLSEFMPFPVINAISQTAVTVRQVLSHSSGLAGWDTGGVIATPTFDAKQALESMLHANRTGQYEGDYSPVWVSAPGEAPRYSNLGISLLGLMIEHVNPDGLSYEEFIHHHLFDPLELRNSVCLRAPASDAMGDEFRQRIAEGVLMLGGAQLRSPELYYQCFAGQGALSTPADYLRIVSMLLRGGVHDGRRILQASSVREMLSPQHTRTMPLTGALPGLALMLNRWGQSRRSFSHAGSYAWGWRSAAYAWPEHATALVVSANLISIPRASTDIHQILHFVEDWLITELPAAEGFEDSTDWNWKLSYCRGLLMVEATYGWLGLRQRPSEDEIRAWADAIESAPDAPSHWSREGFLSGVSDLLDQEFTRAGLRAFLTSPQIKVDQADIEQAFYQLGSAPDQCLYPSLLHMATAADFDW